MTIHGPDYGSLHQTVLERRAARDLYHESGNFRGRATLRCVGMAMVCVFLFAGFSAYDHWWKDDVGAALETRLARLVAAPQDLAIPRSLGS